MSQKAGDSFVAIDVETTGLSFFAGDRIIEIGAVLVEEGRIVSEFDQLIHTLRPISHSAQRVHGIGNRMLQGKPAPEEVIPRFCQWAGSQPVIAHNARFDLGFIRQECSRLGLHFPNRFSCTLTLARRRLPGLPNHRLETVARHLLGELPAEITLHRALADACLVAQIWLAMTWKAS
jgi:DNA polymerase-3 subunit epsilon